jgi:hypothetical protein
MDLVIGHDCIAGKKTQAIITAVDAKRLPDWEMRQPIERGMGKKKPRPKAR